LYLVIKTDRTLKRGQDTNANGSALYGTVGVKGVKVEVLMC